MAFASKIGSLLRRSRGSNPSLFNAMRWKSWSTILFERSNLSMALPNNARNSLERSVGSNLSFSNAIRCILSSKVFVGGLGWGTDDHSLAQAFSQHGHVVEAKVALDRDSGRSRGIGFVTFNNFEEACKAIAAQDGKELHGCTVLVRFADDRTGGRGGGGGGGGRGGGGSGGGGPRRQL